METRKPSSGQQPTILLISSLFLIYYATATYICTHLFLFSASSPSSSPLYILSVSTTAYAWYSLSISLLGLVGAHTHKPILLTIFSNHLLIDTVLSLVLKAALLWLFHDMTSDICFSPSLSFSSSSSSTSRPHHHASSFWEIPGGSSSAHHAFSSQPGGHHPAGSNGSGSGGNSPCDVGVTVARFVLLVFLGLFTTAQWGLGLYVRRYAASIDSVSLRREERSVSVSDETSSAIKEDRDVEKAEVL